MRRPRWLPRLRRSKKVCPECGGSVSVNYCELCGYDLVRKAQADIALHRPSP
jgi:predicted amidophosphoribosyltransferase